MGDVVNLDDYRGAGVMTGPCVCTGCKHEWVASSPPGVTDFECPSCSAFKGVWVAPVIPDMFWRCLCGGSLFYLLPDGAAQCRECGTCVEVFDD